MNPLSRAAALAAASTCLGMVCVPAASADESAIHTLGSPAELTNGDVVQAWTVKDLRPSADVIPYPVAGTLWQATASDAAVQGNVQPVIPNFSARARSGQTYRVLFGVATPQGVNPAVLSPGQQSTGLIYFDVTGDAPDSVVYNSGGPDLAVWVQPPPTPPRSATTSGTASSPNAVSLPATPAPALPPTAPPAAPPALAPVSAGTPVVPGSPMMPPTAPSSTGTAPSQSAPGVPPPASVGTPLPAATGTPAPADVGSTPAAVTPSPVAPPAGSAGTPAGPNPGGTPAVAPTTTIAPPP